jgi:hypothetical protein
VVYLVVASLVSELKRFNNLSDDGTGRFGGFQSPVVMHVFKEFPHSDIPPLPADP